MHVGAELCEAGDRTVHVGMGDRTVHVGMCEAGDRTVHVGMCEAGYGSG